MTERKKARITVIKKMANMKTRELHMMGFDPENPKTRPCGFLKDGQEWVVGSQAPADFCHWAWADIQGIVMTLARGGNFLGVRPGIFITCCTDGFRPVFFKLERLPEN